MEEVTAFQNGELDYMNIRGGTGPLVYPAGFLYLYSFFKWVASSTMQVGDGGGGGTHQSERNDIFVVQVLFCILYVMNAAVVLSIYSIVIRNERNRIISSTTASATDVDASATTDDSEDEKSKSSARMMMKNSHIIWSWRIGMGLMCLSKRIHSIFILRLFNDAPCMFLFYISVYLFLQSKMKLGCVFFSLAVSIKMNIFLFAPGLLLLLIQCSSSWVGTVGYLSICAGVQLLLGAPFLLTYPVSYIRKAFEFDRVFFFKWTVNWKFLREDFFISKPLSLILLALHLATLALFAKKWIKSNGGQKTFFLKQKQQQTQIQRLNPTYIVSTLFVSNFIGIVFARTLHYQFYSWYFHSLPLLLWTTDLPLWCKVIVMCTVEYSFNVFPATPVSSALLQLAHCVTLAGLWSAKVPPMMNNAEKGKKE